MPEPIEKRIAKIVESEAQKGRIVSAVSVKGSEIRVEYLPPKDFEGVNEFDLMNFRRERKERHKPDYQAGRHLPRWLRDEILERDKHKCAYCGETQDEMHVDHVIPRSRGGLHDAKNLVAACPDCNRSKSWKTIEEWRPELLNDPKFSKTVHS